MITKEELKSRFSAKKCQTCSNLQRIECYDIWRRLKIGDKVTMNSSLIEERVTALLPRTKNYGFSIGLDNVPGFYCPDIINPVNVENRPL